MQLKYFDPKDPWRIFRIIGEFVEGFDELAGVGPAVAVFGGARCPPDSPHYDLTRRVCRRLGEEGFAIISGGGPGLMEAANRGARDAAAKSVGLNIDIPVLQQNMNPFVDLGVNFRFFFARKVMFTTHACGFVTFPGGMGTLDEFFEALTLTQTGKMDPRPAVLVGRDYWGGLLAWMREKMLGHGYIVGADLELFHVTDDPEEVVRFIQNHPFNARHTAEAAPAPNKVSHR